ncbi:MAG: hypothetical protein IJR42_07400 [Paludibacteraceae bacterium]|nr:hypothetical protein [Paludibacteraceae bacterium]
MKLVDPERKYGFSTPLIEAWNRLPLVEQQKLYLYLLYRKWRGLDIYGEPFFIIHNCHPVPFNWNGQTMVNSLIKEKRVVSAKYNGSFGIYTWDEAKLYGMTDVKPLN